VTARPTGPVAPRPGAVHDPVTATPAGCAVGVDIGGTKVLAALVDPAGTVLAEERVPSPARWDEMREVVVELVQRLRDTPAAGGGFAGVGVGAAGMVDLEGVIHYAPNVPGFRKVPVQAELAAALGCPVVVDNDANVAALAEARLGAARGLRHAIVITLGTGVGGGILVDGRVLRGGHGFAAEVGHFQIDPHGPLCACGEIGHWEALASGNALGELARRAVASGRGRAILAAAGGDPGAVTGEHVSAAAHRGDPDALAVVDRYAYQVAIGLVGLANIFDPELIAIAGGLVNDGDLYLEPIRAHFLGHIEGAAYRPTPAIVPAALGERAGVIGAALAAWETGAAAARREAGAP